MDESPHLVNLEVRKRGHPSNKDFKIVCPPLLSVIEMVGISLKLFNSNNCHISRLLTTRRLRGSIGFKGWPLHGKWRAQTLSKLLHLRLFAAFHNNQQPEDEQRRELTEFQEEFFGLLE
jgi:hypothetical protein